MSDRDSGRTDPSWRQQLSAYADGALDEAERQHIEDLLRSSEEGRAELAEIESTLVALRRAVPVTEEPDWRQMAQQITRACEACEAVERQRRERSRARNRWLLAGAGLAAAAAAASVALVLRNTEEQSTADRGARTAVNTQATDTATAVLQAPSATDSAAAASEVAPFEDLLDPLTASELSAVEAALDQPTPADDNPIDILLGPGELPTDLLTEPTADWLDLDNLTDAEIDAIARALDTIEAG